MGNFDATMAFNEEEGISTALLLAAKFEEIQVELERIQQQSSYEIQEVEKKFNEIRKPLYAQRNEAIGLAQEFWPIAFCGHPTLGKLLSKEDQKILKHMVSLEVEVAEDVKSHSITFYFSPNPYFEDEKLTKTYCIDEKNNLSIICQPIKWKEGKGITFDDGHDMGGSFFNWFSEAVRSDGRVDEIAEAIKDDLWRDPFIHFRYKVGTMRSSSEEEIEEDVNTMSSSREEEIEEEVNTMSSSREVEIEEELSTLASYPPWENEEEVNTMGPYRTGRNKEEIDAMELYGEGEGEEKVNTMSSGHEGKNEEVVDARNMYRGEKFEWDFRMVEGNWL